MLSVFFISYLKALGLLLIATVTIIVLFVTYRRNRHVNYTCFIAGSTSLAEERDAIRAAISQISNKRKKISLAAFTYEDFPNKVITGGPQNTYYNNFLKTSADFAIFIIDGEIGKETCHEFEIAYDAFKNKHKPVIFVYCKDCGEDHEQSDELKARLISARHYWRTYSDLANLKLLFKEDMINELDSYAGELHNFDDVHKRKSYRGLIAVVAVLLAALPVASLIDDPDSGEVSGKERLEQVDGMRIKDELAEHGRIIVDSRSLVKYKVSPTPLKRIDWKNVVDVITGTDTIYPKSNAYLYFFSEGADGKKQEKEFFFDFHAFIEKSIRTSDMQVLKEMFYSIKDKDHAIYCVGDIIEEDLTPHTADNFFKHIKNSYHIDYVKFAGETDIFSSKYPRVDTIKCSR